MSELKQSTSVKVKIGPFVDVGDAFTPETGIVLTGAGAADEAELLKHDAAAVVDISGRTWAAIADCDGWYNLTLTTADTDTLGELTVVVQDDSVCLPVFVRFEVVAQQYWDSKYGADLLQVDVREKGLATLALTTQEKADVQGALSGSGSVETIVECLETDDDPVADADVWITTDAAGANIIAGTKQSNAQGKVTFYLDPGTYYVFAQKDGWDGLLGSVLTVV